MCVYIRIRTKKKNSRKSVSCIFKRMLCGLFYIIIIMHYKLSDFFLYMYKYYNMQIFVNIQYEGILSSLLRYEKKKKKSY